MIKNKLLLAMFFCVSVGVQAKVRSVRSLDDFMKRVSRAEYSVALFVDKSKENMRNDEKKRLIKDLEIMFKSVSDDSQYKDADLQFLSVDVARKNAIQIAQNYAITAFPATIVLLGRQAVAGALRQGNIYRDQLQQLIDTHLSTQMSEVMKRKAEAQKRALERAKVRALTYPNWGYGGYWGGYPYWGWGGGYYGGYWGRRFWW